MAKVKICGITSIEDGTKAMLLGADYIGLIVGIKRSKSNLAMAKARKIALALHKKIPIVVLTELSKAKDIAALCEHLNCELVQIAGECKKTELEKLRAIAPNLKIIKAIAVAGKGKKAVSMAKSLSGIVDFFVLDSAGKNGAGGTGKIHDWKKSAEIIKESRIPCFLAGGLNPENVSDAIKETMPLAVDVSSGVKKEKNKRILDEEKTAAFIAKASQARKQK